MTTIEDIAKEAGVSIATVSRVLNGRGYVAEATRAAVLRAASKLGRSVDPEFLRKRILVACVPSGHALVEPIMKAAEGYNLSPLYKIVSSASLRADDVAFDGDFDGVLLIDGVISRAELEKLRARVPVVECRNYNDVEREVSVMVDDVAMGYRLTKHLTDTGKTRVATVLLNGGISSRPHVVERMQGYRAALAEAGLSPAVSYRRDFPGGADGFLPLLRRDAGREWDALIYPEPMDELAELLRLLRADGLDVPGNVALASFGDSPALERAGITATRQPLEAIAGASLFMLDGLMSGRLEVAESMQLRLRPELSIRGSSQPLL